MPGETLRADPQSQDIRIISCQRPSQNLKRSHNLYVAWCCLRHYTILVFFGVCSSMCVMLNGDITLPEPQISELWEYLISKFRSVKWIFGLGNKQLTEESFKQSWHLFPQRLRAFSLFRRAFVRFDNFPCMQGWQLSTRSPSCLWWVCLPSVACGWRSTDQLCKFPQLAHRSTNLEFLLRVYHD